MKNPVFLLVICSLFVFFLELSLNFENAFAQEPTIDCEATLKAWRMDPKIGPQIADQYYCPHRYGYPVLRPESVTPQPPQSVTPQEGQRWAEEEMVREKLLRKRQKELEREKELFELGKSELLNTLKELGSSQPPAQSEPPAHSLRERWLTELLTLRAEVRGIQKVLRRLDKSMQNDQQQRKEWEKTTSEAYARALESAKSLFVDLTVDLHDSYFNDKLEKATTPEQRERFKRALRLVQRLKELQDVEDFAAWASNEEFGREEIIEGLKMIAELLLQDKKILAKLGPSFALERILTIKNAAEHIVNSAYDITAEVLSWRAINQLNKNSEAYLNAVNALSTRMTQLGKRITELKDKLEALPEEE